MTLALLALLIASCAPSVSSPRSPVPTPNATRTASPAPTAISSASSAVGAVPIDRCGLIDDAFLTDAPSGGFVTISGVKFLVQGADPNRNVTLSAGLAPGVFACARGFGIEIASGVFDLRSGSVATAIVPPSSHVDVPTTLAEADAWKLVRSSVPASISVLKPGWLPQRYARSSVVVEYAHSVGSDWGYRVGYSSRSDGRPLLMALGSVNAAAPTTSRVKRIGAAEVTVATTASWPAIAAYWNFGGMAYSVQTADPTLTEEELGQVVEGMLPTIPPGP